LQKISTERFFDRGYSDQRFFTFVTAKWNLLKQVDTAGLVASDGPVGFEGADNGVIT